MISWFFWVLVFLPASVHSPFSYGGKEVENWYRTRKAEEMDNSFSTASEKSPFKNEKMGPVALLQSEILLFAHPYRCVYSNTCII